LLNFVKIELRGFKSFADKVEIPFNEGVTAIIGPNGCGKSNVSDAIRWTLGEKSAKQLRGKSMQDVIFAGTEKRRSMSYCEVSLTFNNENKRLFPTLPFDEVVITRKMDRSGISEYYLNHENCRLRDIIDLLHDTGMGKEGYSIIGQGRVDEIMSAKPDDRRHIFEEAAGISKFRAERDASERNLEKAKLNLESANEVINEIEKQITPLKKQAEAAMRYAELKEQLKHNEVNLYIYNYEHSQQTKQKIADRIEDATLQLKKKDEEYNECMANYSRCMDELAGIDKNYDEYNAELMSLKVDAARFEGEASLVKERVSHIQSEIARLNDELASIDRQLLVSDQLIEEETAKKSEIFSQFLAASKEQEILEEKSSRLISSIKGKESDIENSNSAYLKAVEELGAIKGNISGLQSALGFNREHAKSLNELILQKKARLNEEETNLAIYDGKIKAVKDKTLAAMQTFNESLAQKKDAQSALESYAEDIDNLRKKLAAAEARFNLFSSVKESYEGYQPAVSKLMKDSKHDSVLKAQIIGVLAELLDVPQDFEAAIEYALGGAMQNIIVETESEASSLIAYLKQNGYGRVTFRPLSACRPHTLMGESRLVLNEPGCFGLASDLIHYDPKIEKVVETLLGTTVIVNNIDNATRIFRKYNQAFKIVTLDGEIFSRNGEITGGSRRNQTQGLLSQEKQIEQARVSVEKLKDNIAKIINLRSEKELEISALEEKIDEMNKEISELRLSSMVDAEKAAQARESAAKLNEEIEHDAEEYRKTQASIKEAEDQLNSIDALEKVVAEKKEEINALVTDSKSENDKTKDERDEVMKRVVENKVVVAQLKQAMDMSAERLLGHETTKHSLEEDKINTAADLRREQNNLESIKNAPEKTVFSKEDEARIKELEDKIAELSGRKRTINDEIAAYDRQKEEIFNERNVLVEKKTRDEGMLENVDSDMRAQEAHVLQEYDLTYSTALEFKDEEFKAYGALTVISDLKRAIYRLGDVNQLAAQTLKETEERLQQQILYRDDIQKAYDDIMQIIADLTKEMQGRFTEAFEQISVNFKEVFSQLFGGGKGELRLDTKETDDVLEAGIEIFAQPPGKKLQNISLLSGGERALTAIAILFAILRLKPMPFCVLDEIEAALDDANVNLFAEFLKKFSDFTQFIVITHRKPTMRHADTIFGVTMEEKGVTKIVSIAFEDAVKQAR